MPAPQNEDRGTRRHAPDTACSRPNLAAVPGGVLRQLDVDRRRFHRRRAFSARALAQPRMGAVFLLRQPIRLSLPACHAIRLGVDLALWQRQRGAGLSRLLRASVLPLYCGRLRSHAKRKALSSFCGVGGSRVTHSFSRAVDLQAHPRRLGTAYAPALERDRQVGRSAAHVRHGNPAVRAVRRLAGAAGASSRYAGRSGDTLRPVRFDQLLWRHRPGHLLRADGLDIVGGAWWSGRPAAGLRPFIGGFGRAERPSRVGWRRKIAEGTIWCTIVMGFNDANGLPPAPNALLAQEGPHDLWRPFQRPNYTVRPAGECWAACGCPSSTSPIRRPTEG